MPSVRATLSVAAPVEVIYRYLRERYHRPAHCLTSQATKGYVPTIVCLEDDEPFHLSFSVKGRDSSQRTAVGSWEWEYDLVAVTATTAEVTICYRWSWWMGFLGGGTIRHQAANEL